MRGIQTLMVSRALPKAYREWMHVQVVLFDDPKAIWGRDRSGGRLHYQGRNAICRLGAR